MEADSGSGKGVGRGFFKVELYVVTVGAQEIRVACHPLVNEVIAVADAENAFHDIGRSEPTEGSRGKEADSGEACDHRHDDRDQKGLGGGGESAPGEVTQFGLLRQEAAAQR